MEILSPQRGVEKKSLKKENQKEPLPGEKATSVHLPHKTEGTLGAGKGGLKKWQH